MGLNPQSFHIDCLLMFDIIWWKYLFFQLKMFHDNDESCSVIQLVQKCKHTACHYYCQNVNVWKYSFATVINAYGIHVNKEIVYRINLTLYIFRVTILYIYIYIYMCVCVCVCNLIQNCCIVFLVIMYQHVLAPVLGHLQ